MSNLPLLHNLLTSIHLRGRDFVAAAASAEATLAAVPALSTSPTFSFLRYRVLCDLLTCAIETKDSEKATSLASTLLLSATSKHLTPPQVAKVLELTSGAPPNSPPPAIAFRNSPNQTPISFQVTFPGSTFAIAGDTVTAKLSLTSRITAAPLTVTAADLRFSFGTVKWSLPGGPGGPGGLTEIVLLPNRTVSFDVSVPLPANVAARRRNSLQGPITVDAAVSRLEKPLTAGFNRAGGASFVPAVVDSDESGAAGVPGGVPVCCTSIAFTLANGCSLKVDQDKSVVDPPPPPLGEEAAGPVMADSKRAKEDYLVNSFGALTEAGVAHGPRILRVLGPIPKLKVTDMTSALTDGRGLDGAVHRIVYKLRAGDEEVCNNLEVEMFCANSFASSDSTRVTPWQRRAMFVEPGVETDPSPDVLLPAGWKPLGSKGGMGTDEPIKLENKLENLQSGGSCAYVAVHLYRPPPNRPTVPAMHPGKSEADVDFCKSEYEVVFSYEQVLNGGMPKMVRRRHVGVISWSEPISAGFSLGAVGNAFPAGVKHGDNMAREKENAPGSFEPDRAAEGGSDRGGGGGGGEKHGEEVCLVSGQKVKVRISMSSARAQHLPVRLERVTFSDEVWGFEKQVDPNSSVTVKLESGSKENSGVLYEGADIGKLTEMKVQTKIGVGYVLVPTLSESASDIGETVAANLGAVRLKWSPLSLTLPSEITSNAAISVSNASVDPALHGPLPSTVGGDIQFLNPAAGVQRAPFAVTCAMPAECRVAQPAAIRYTIENRSGLHQYVSVEMDEVYDNSIVMDGLKQGSLHFGPRETRTLVYNAVFLLPGKTRLPSIRCVSKRHASFVIGGALFAATDGGGGAGAGGSVFVSP